MAFHLLNSSWWWGGPLTSHSLDLTQSSHQSRSWMIEESFWILPHPLPRLPKLELNLMPLSLASLWAKRPDDFFITIAVYYETCSRFPWVRGGISKLYETISNTWKRLRPVESTGEFLCREIPVKWESCAFHSCIFSYLSFICKNMHPHTQKNLKITH